MQHIQVLDNVYLHTDIPEDKSKSNHASENNLAHN